ncbi:hypothetical protein ACWEGE_12295 [Amycolatopsis sp. NPDC004747]
MVSRLPASRQFDVGQLLDLLEITLSVVAGFGGVVLLAGVYAMAGLADDWADKRQVILRVIRDRTKGSWSELDFDFAA